MKKLFQVLCGIFLSASLVTSVTGTINAAPYKSYNYVNGNNGITDVAAPTAYLPVRVLDENNLGVNYLLQRISAKMMRETFMFWIPQPVMFILLHQTGRSDIRYSDIWKPVIKTQRI